MTSPEKQSRHLSSLPVMATTPPAYGLYDADAGTAAKTGWGLVQQLKQSMKSVRSGRYGKKFPILYIAGHSPQKIAGKNAVCD